MDLPKSMTVRSQALSLSESSRRRALRLCLVGIALTSAACARSGRPPLIAYSDPAAGQHTGRVAQATIDAWRQPRTAEIPLQWTDQKQIRSGYAGDIDFAEAMVALPGLVAGVGPLSSRATLLVAPIYAERGIPLISATATTSRLRLANPWVFPLAPDDDEEGDFIVTFLRDSLHAGRVIIFYLAADEYGLGLRRGVVRALRRDGIASLDEIAIVGDSDLPQLVKESRRVGTPDAIVVAARTAEARRILRAMRPAWPRVPMILGDGAAIDSATLLQEGAAGQPIYSVKWWDPAIADSSSQEFAARYFRLTGVHPTAFDAMQYDAIMVAAAAVREVGPRPERIRRYLSELGTSRPPYRGITGPIAFNAGRRVNLVMARMMVAGALSASRP